MFAFRTVFVRGLVRFGVRTSQILLALALEPRSDFAIQLAAVSRMRRHHPKTIILIRISGRRVSEFFLLWLSLSSLKQSRHPGQPRNDSFQTAIFFPCISSKRETYS